MDRRMQPRLPAEQTVQVTILGANEISIIGRVVEVSGRGMRLLVDCPVEPHSPILIDLGDSSLSGEVRYCRAGDTGFVIGLQLEQAPGGVKNLVGMLR